MPKTLRVRNVSPLGEVQSWLARRTFAYGEVVELDADIVGQAPSLRLLEEDEELVAGHSIEVEGIVYYSDPGYGLLAQVEHFELVTEDDPAPAVEVTPEPAPLPEVEPLPAPVAAPSPILEPAPAPAQAPADAPADAPAPLVIPPTPAPAPVFVMGGQIAPASPVTLDPAAPADSTTAPTAA